MRTLGKYDADRIGGLELAFRDVNLRVSAV